MVDLRKKCVVLREIFRLLEDECAWLRYAGAWWGGGWMDV